MSIVIYTGKPRGGKSYRCHEKEFLAEVIYGERIIVTNLAILLPEFLAYLAKHHPSVNWDPHKKLRILSHEETQHFYLRRTLDPSQDLKHTTLAEQKAKIFPDFGSVAGSGVLYILDEAHVYFDARCWAEAGPTLTYYNSQHAKLNDRVVFVTQFMELLDKRVKGFAQSVSIVRNYSKERFLTVFSMPRVFEERVFPREPLRGDIPETINVFRLDPELAATYDTTQGVGITGRRMPERAEKRGLPLWLIVPAVIAAGAAVFYLSEWPLRYFQDTVQGTKPKVVKQKIEGVDIQRSLPPWKVDRPHETMIEVKEPVRPNSVRLQGWVAHSGRVQVYLTDGRILTEADPELERVDSRGVIVAGKRLFPVKPSSPQPQLRDAYKRKESATADELPPDGEDTR